MQPASLRNRWKTTLKATAGFRIHIGEVVFDSGEVIFHYSHFRSDRLPLHEHIPDDIKGICNILYAR